MFSSWTDLRRRLREPVKIKPRVDFSLSPAEFAGSLVWRLIDLVIALSLLVFTFPLMAVVAIAIKCDSSGPLFEQEERTEAGRQFKLLSFRTTCHDFEPLVTEWDRPPTGIGRFLRYTHIETLPRLANLLRGDISLSQGNRLRGHFQN